VLVGNDAGAATRFLAESQRLYGTGDWKMRKTLSSLVIALMLGWAGAANAGNSANVIENFAKGVEAHRAGDYVTALHEFRELAKQNSPLAQFALGGMYHYGQGVAQDYVLAVKWYRLAALQGFTVAQYSLGVMYEGGLGVTQDYADAVKWYRLAANKGDDLAQFALGLAYAQGQGVAQDFITAHIWANIAAASGSSPAAELRDLVAGQMIPSQIAEAQKLAREWMEKHQTQ